MIVNEEPFWRRFRAMSVQYPVEQPTLTIMVSIISGDRLNAVALCAGSGGIGL